MDPSVTCTRLISVSDSSHSRSDVTIKRPTLFKDWKSMVQRLNLGVRQVYQLIKIISSSSEVTWMEDIPMNCSYSTEVRRRLFDLV